jgi:Protein of unknown function (DUF3489)
LIFRFPPGCRPGSRQCEVPHAAVPMEDQEMTARKQTKGTEIGAVKKAPVKSENTRTTAVRGRLKPASASAGGGLGSKRSLLIARICRPEGARIDDLTRGLGWLPHTVRAALTRLRRKGYIVACEKTAGEASVYRATPPAAQKVSNSQKGKKVPRTASRRAA